MNRRFIVLDVSPDYLLEHVKPNVFYRTYFEIDGEERYGYFFILNGNLYYEFPNDHKHEDYVCCSIMKLKRFITKENIRQFIFKHNKREQLETVNDLCVMVMQCGYKREIDFYEYYEAENNLKSDFSKRCKFEDFNFVSKALNPADHPGDALITKSMWGSTITLDMVSDERNQPVPDCIKEDICYFANNILEENMIDVKNACFLLHAKIDFRVIGTLYKDYQVYIIMIDEDGEKLHEERFFLCDCEHYKEDVMEEYFKNELFPCKETEKQNVAKESD